MVFYEYETMFRVADYWEKISPLGKGAYGAVCSAKDTRPGSSGKKTVAIKKVKEMSKESLEAKQTLREIKLLAQFGQHQNIIKLLAVQVDSDRDDLYLFLTLMDTDLHRIIQSSQPLSLDHIRHFLFQILRGVQFLHAHSVLHRDLKPANLLVNKDCHLRISDFGLARAAPRNQIHPKHKPMFQSDHSQLRTHDSIQSYESINFEEKQLDFDNLEREVPKQPLTTHVVTRWYRAPELMLNPDGLYCSGVDLWSIGCILGEMISRNPLFPGKNFIDQLRLIFTAIGTPKVEEAEYVNNKSARKFLSSLKVRRAEDFHKILKTKCSKSVDLVLGLLRFDRKKRLGVFDCFVHDFFSGTPYVAEINRLVGKLQQIDVVTRNKQVGEYLNDFENYSQSLDLDSLRELIHDEVSTFDLSSSRKSITRKPLVPKVTEPSLRSQHSRSGTKMEAFGRETISSTPMNQFNGVQKVDSSTIYGSSGPSMDTKELARQQTVVGRVSHFTFPRSKHKPVAEKQFRTRYSESALKLHKYHSESVKNNIDMDSGSKERRYMRKSVPGFNASVKKTSKNSLVRKIGKPISYVQREFNAVAGVQKFKGSGPLVYESVSLNGGKSLPRKDAVLKERVLRTNRMKERLNIRRYLH